MKKMTSKDLTVVLLVGVFIFSLLLAMAGEEITLYFMHFYSEADQDSYSVSFHQILNQFIKNNPQYKIKQEILSHDNYEVKIKTLAAANELPDVFMIKGYITTITVF